MTQHLDQEHKHWELYTSGYRTQGQEPVQENNISGTPQVPHQTLMEAIKELPRQYVNVLIKPSAEKFAQQMGKARWSLVWIQLILYLAASLAYVLFAAWFPSLHDGLRPSTIPGLNIPLSTVVEDLLLFFVTMGLFYLLARMFRGQGTILAQSYTMLMLNVPLELLALVGLAFLLIPFAGVAIFSIWFLVWFIYSIFLQIYALMAVHRLSGGKAAGVFFMTVLPLIAYYAIVAPHIH